MADAAAGVGGLDAAALPAGVRLDDLRGPSMLDATSRSGIPAELSAALSARDKARVVAGGG